MSIQSGINQLLGTAAIFSQLPAGQSIAKDTKLKGQFKKEKAIYDRLNNLGMPDNPQVANQTKAVEKRLAATTSEMASNRPTTGNIAKALAYDVTPEQANAHMQQEGQKQVKQKRNFLDYVGRLETMGGKVSDLPMNMQREIAKGYSKHERKKMMDRMDEEDNK